MRSCLPSISSSLGLLGFGPSDVRRGLGPSRQLGLPVWRELGRYDRELPNMSNPEIMLSASSLGRRGAGAWPCLQLIAHVLRVAGSEHVDTQAPLLRQVVLRLLLVEGDALGLVADNTVNLPSTPFRRTTSQRASCPSRPSTPLGSPAGVYAQGRISLVKSTVCTRPS